MGIISTSGSGYNIYYNDNNSIYGSLTTRTILIFMVGTAITASSYSNIFSETLNNSGTIVYVLDPNPGVSFKTYQGFLDKLQYVESNIKTKLGITELSGKYYIGGHSAGGIIAMNHLFPPNKGLSGNIQITNTIYNTQAVSGIKFKGYIGMDPVDGKDDGTEYGQIKKYDPSSNTTYVDEQNNINPVPIIIFGSDENNTQVDVSSGGQKMYKTAVKNVTNMTNKFLYAFQYYHHMDYVDANTLAYAIDTSRTLNDANYQNIMTLRLRQFFGSRVSTFINSVENNDYTSSNLNTQPLNTKYSFLFFWTRTIYWGNRNNPQRSPTYTTMNNLINGYYTK